MIIQKFIIVRAPRRELLWLTLLRKRMNLQRQLCPSVNEVIWRLRKFELLNTMISLIKKFPSNLFGFLYILGPCEVLDLVTSESGKACNICNISSNNWYVHIIWYLSMKFGYKLLKYSHLNPPQMISDRYQMMWTYQLLEEIL